MSGPLDGLRGIAVTESPSAAYAAGLFALLGADMVSIAVEPGADEGVDLLQSLLPEADFVLEDCARRVLGEAGLDVEGTRVAHPNAVWCAIASRKDEVRADVTSAWQAVAGVLLALHHRAAVGVAQRIDLDLRTLKVAATAEGLPAALPLAFVPTTIDAS